MDSVVTAVTQVSVELVDTVDSVVTVVTQVLVESVV